MATIKAYTDLEQSRKLAEILPVESADMRFCFSHTLSGRVTGHYPMIGREPSMGTTPCWSLAALLDFLKPDIYLEHEDGVGWKVSEYVVIEKPNSVLDDIKCVQGFSKDNSIDACYDMILKLHEQKVL